MQKSKLIVFLYSLIAVSLATPEIVHAITPQVSITKLNSYVNTNNFKLSYSAIADDPGSITAQFYYSKNGGPMIAFGPVINGASGQVQLSNSQVNQETNYVFEVRINSGADSDTTSTIYDTSATSSISGYTKERIGDGTYKLKWRNPENTDFDKVIIYRGETVDFSADASHEIARVAGSPNSDMSYEDHFAPDASKTYYYAIRAIDHAGNSAALVGDGGTGGSTTGTVSGASTTGTPSSVVSLPSEKGSVLGDEVDATATATPEVVGSVDTTPGLFKWILTHKKISLGVAAVLGALAYFLYSKSKKK